MNRSLARFCPSKVSAQRFRVRGVILFVILLARAVLIYPIIGITWILFLVSIGMFHYIRKFTSKLIMSHYDIYTIMAEIEEQDKTIPRARKCGTARALWF
jgi:hypothetical protein